MTQSTNGHSRSGSRGGNTPEWQRLGALIGGGTLALLGLTRRSRAGTALAAAGGLLVWRGATMQQHTGEYQAEASFLINRPAEEAYRFWCNFENLPRFMSHLESVKVTGDKTSEWTASGPGGAPIRWNAEIVEDRPNERIAWRSRPGSDLQNEGSVEFSAGPAQRGTMVRATMRYRPPAGPLGRAVAKMVGKDPEFAMREDLRRFKALIEAGEVPTTLGQPHGPRGLRGHAEQVMLREKQNMPEPQAPATERRSA